MTEYQSSLPGRLREVRIELYGADGIPAIAEILKIPPRTWGNYERGVEVPGWAILLLIETFSVEPHWLLTGEGGRFRARHDGHQRDTVG